MKIEARGIRCLDCHSIDLKTRPEISKGGFGQCTAWNPVRFVSFSMSRNCAEFTAAPADLVEARDTWAASQPMFWQRK